MNTKLIPNTFQHPNAYIDWLAYYLTPEEEKVLNKAIREILGWHNRIEARQARIALSIFEHGKVSKETGEQLCLGCGLGRAAIRKALRSLDEYKILVRVGSATNDGQMYRIQDNYQLVDLDALKDRREQQDAKNASRTSKAREVLCDKGGVVAHNPPHVVAHNPRGIVGQTQRNPVETQKETQNLTPSGVVLPDGMTEMDLSGLVEFHACDEQQAIAHWCRLNEQTPGEKPKPDRKDAVEDIVQQAGRRAAGVIDWLLPGTPAGDHPYRQSFETFCVVIRRGPKTVGEKRALSWLKQLETIAGMPEEVTVPPGILDQAIRAIRGEWGFEHKVWRTPYSDGFVELAELTAVQIMEGTHETQKALEVKGRYQ